MSKSYKRNAVRTNKNAVIVNRQDRTGKFRTETSRRDEGSVTMAVSTNSSSNSTQLYIDFPTDRGSDFVQLNGREARTLYRLLRSHYAYTGKPRR